MSKTIIIRCRANTTTGFGHLVRSRVLAKVLNDKGHRVVLIGPSKTYMLSSDKLLFVEWIEREGWGSAKEEALVHIALAKKYNVHHLIMDDYRSDYAHQLLLRKAGLKTLQQYDASKAQKFAADIVVNGSPYEKRSMYEEVLYSQDIVMLHGPKYAILRDAFLDLDLKKVKKENKILITFGGGDDHGAVIYALNEISAPLPKEWSIVVVLGEHNPNINTISSYIKENNFTNVTLLVNPENMPLVIASCKVAILSGGTTTFEAASLGVVGILMPIAKNQYNQGIGWDSLGAMKYLKPYAEIEKNELKNALLVLVNSENKLNKMSECASTYVDGQGAFRLIETLLK